MSYTPAPWYVSAAGHTVYALHDVPERNRFFALVQSGRRDDAQDDELSANARLISSAPDLLEALQAVIRVADRATDEFDQARAAIAKALGTAG